jgi:catalase
LSVAGALDNPAFGLAAEPHETPASMVGALHSAFGEHHARAVHAKGVILRGRFTPTAEASAPATEPHVLAATLAKMVRP